MAFRSALAVVSLLTSFALPAWAQDSAAVGQNQQGKVQPGSGNVGTSASKQADDIMRADKKKAAAAKTGEKASKKQRRNKAAIQATPDARGPSAQ